MKAAEPTTRPHAAHLHAGCAQDANSTGASLRPILRGAALVGACVLALAACKPTAAPEADTKPSSTAATDTPADLSATAPADPQPAAADAEAADVDAEPAMPKLAVDTINGKPYDLAAHRGKWVVVNYWATWCAPCRKEMPELSALDAMRENVEVIGLAYEDITPDDMTSFLEKHPVVYPIAILDTMAPPADFASPQGLPMTYLIAPDGTVAKRFLGPITAKEIEDTIAATETNVA